MMLPSCLFSRFYHYFHAIHLWLLLNQHYSRSVSSCYALNSFILLIFIYHCLNVARVLSLLIYPAFFSLFSSLLSSQHKTCYYSARPAGLGLSHMRLGRLAHRSASVVKMTRQKLACGGVTDGKWLGGRWLNGWLLTVTGAWLSWWTDAWMAYVLVCKSDADGRS